jgi:hypothetical protein
MLKAWHVHENISYRVGHFYPNLPEVGKDVIEGEIWGKKIADIAFNFADF